MEFRLKYVLVLFLSVAASAQTVQQTIDAITAAAPFQRAIWGIDIEQDDGTIIYQRNANALVVPASNRKLFAMAMASECLGFTAQLPTELWIDGDDVIVRGNGDPSFGSERHASLGFAPFIAALQQRNIRSVRDILVDVSRFDRVTIPYNWKVGNLVSDYAAPVDAIAYDENVIGDVPVADAGINAALRFRDALREAGITVTGEVHTIIEPRQLDLRLATVPSPFVFQLMMTALKNSHNLYAEMLYKRATPDGKYDEAEEEEASFLRNEVGLADGEFRFVDGSGLAPDDLITPSGLVKMLRWMNDPYRRSMWWALLAQPGQEGTLHFRLTEYADRLRGKTGTVNGVNSISGIIAGRNGHYRYFSVVINHHLATSSQATALLDEVVHTIADFQ